MTADSVIRDQLVAARSCIDPALALIGGTETGPAPSGCPHPDSKRSPAPVGGKPAQFRCDACHALVNPGDVYHGA